jgi:hypothetical protein
MIQSPTTAARRPLRAVALCAAVVGCMVPVLASTALPVGAASPTATMAPSSGLGDQERTTIRGTGFDPNTPIQVLECNGTTKSPPQDARSCEGLSLDTSGYTDGQGNYVNSPADRVGTTKGYLVLMLPDTVADLVAIHCGHPQDPRCVVYIGEDHNDFRKKHVFIDLAFKGQPSGGGSGSSGVVIVLLIVVLAAGTATLVWLRSRRARRPGDSKLAGR